MASSPNIDIFPAAPPENVLSKFDRFIQQWPGNRPPRDEIHKLAKNLCGTTERKTNANNNIGNNNMHSGHYNCPRSSMNDTQFSSDCYRVSWDGINARWFSRVFVHLPEVQTMIQFGCRMWFLREFAILELFQKYQQQQEQARSSEDFKSNDEGDKAPVLDRSGPAIDSLLFQLSSASIFQWDLGPITAPATAFISFTGSYTIAHFFELMRHKDLDGQFVWIDTFCVDQMSWTTAVQGPNNLLLDGWENIKDTLSQIWVLWELFATAKNKASLRLLFTDKAQALFVQNGLGAGSFQLFDSLAEIDAEEAAALHNEDKQVILQQMSMEGGVGMVNRVVSECLRDWVAFTGKSYLKHLGNSLHCEDDIIVGNYHWGLVHNLATLLHDEGKYNEAELLYRDALQGRQRLLGIGNKNSLETLNSLALVLHDKGKHQEAESLQRVALDKMRQFLGKSHPETLSSMHNLAKSLHAQAKYEEAESLYENILKKRQQLLGVNHTHTLSCLNDLANLLCNQGRYDEAEAVCRDVLEKRRRLLGESHPRTLSSMNNLAVLLSDKGKYDEAAILYQDACKKMEQLLGEDHPYTLSSMNNLSILLRKQGKLLEAETLKQTSLEKRRQMHGESHPDISSTMNNEAIHISCRIIRYVYGIAANTRWYAGCRFAEDDAEWDAELSEKRVENVFSTLVDRNTHITPGATFKRSGYSPMYRDQKTVSFKIYQAEVVTPTFTTQGCEKLGEMVVPCCGFEDTFDVQLTFGAALRVEVIRQDGDRHWMIIEVE